MHPLRQFLFRNGSAVRTNLRRVTRVDLNHGTTSFRGFVAQHFDQATPRGIMDFFGQYSAGQALDVEFLDGDDAEPPRRSSAVT